MFYSRIIHSVFLTGFSDRREYTAVMNEAMPERTSEPVTLAAIEAARARIAPELRVTPCTHSVTLSAMTGAEVWLKFENLQFTSSFKERGALNALLLLSAEQKSRGVIAMSAGNHAQALAYHLSLIHI